MNIAGDGVLTTGDVVREFARLPLLPQAIPWVEAAGHPAIMGTTNPREQPGRRPPYTGLEALHETLRR